jgi:hypothetical protein
MINSEYLSSSRKQLTKKLHQKMTELKFIESLKENTIYYLRPYAINSKGVGYGSQQTIKTIAQSAISTNLKEGILAFYPLDGNANDASKNGLSLTVKGEVNFKSLGLDRNGKVENCAAYNMYGGLITNSSKINDSKNGFSISVWSKSNVYNLGSGISTFKYIFLNLINDKADEVNFYISQKYYYVNSDFRSNKYLIPSTILFDLDWHHFVLTFDYTNGLIYYYLDGVNQKTVQMTLSNLGLCNLSIGSSYERINLPNGNGSDTQFDRRGWVGYIDDVGIWNRTLSLDEIKYLHKNSFTP